MQTRSSLVRLVTASLLSAGASCGDDEAKPDAMNEPDAATAPQCEGVPAFHLHMQATGEQGLVRGELIEAPPPHKYENDWVVKLTDLEGEALPDLELDRVEPFMPAHGHDGTFEPEISTPGDADCKTADEPGTYCVKRINLWMQDHWEVRFFVHVGSQADEIIFDVCIPP